MTYLHYIWNTILAFIFAAFLWIIAILATNSAAIAHAAFWIGLIVGMIAIQDDRAKRA